MGCSSQRLPDRFVFVTIKAAKAGFCCIGGWNVDNCHVRALFPIHQASNNRGPLDRAEKTEFEMARIDRVGVIAGLAALVIGASATTVVGQCLSAASSSFGSAGSAFQSSSASGSISGSGSAGASFSGGSSGGDSFSSTRIVNNSFGSFPSAGRRSSQSRAATGPLSGNESFSTPFGTSGYNNSMAQQNAAFYRYPLIQKSADVNVRRANRARSDERLAQRRAMRAANRPEKTTPPTAKDAYRSYATNR